MFILLILGLISTYKVTFKGASIVGWKLIYTKIYVFTRVAEGVLMIPEKKSKGQSGRAMNQIGPVSVRSSRLKSKIKFDLMGIK